MLSLLIQGLRERYLYEEEIDDGVLETYNNKCRDRCQDVFIKIDWTKFCFDNILTIDYILAIPLFILGSSFITFVCEGIPYSLTRFINLDLVTLALMFILRSMEAFL